MPTVRRGKRMMGSKKLIERAQERVKHLQPDFVVPVNYLIFICAGEGYICSTLHGFAE